MKNKVKEEVVTSERNFGKYILLAVIVLLIFISYQIVRPYLIVLISSFVLAYLCRPPFKFIKKRFGNSISAITCLILVILIFLGPLAFIFNILANQASNTIKNTEVMSVVNELTSLPFVNELNINWESVVNRVGLYVFSLVEDIASALPAMLLSGLVFIFSFFYILTGWDFIVKQLKNFIPFKNKDRIIQEINSATHGIVFGYLFIAILDFSISAIGLYLAGVKFYLLLSFLVAIFVFVPGLGPSLVNIPLLVYYALASNWYSFGIILVTWAVVSIVIEIFFVSKILAGRARIHPLIMLIGILGGTTLFGIFGFIIGPLILVYTIRIIRELVRKN